MPEKKNTVRILWREERQAIDGFGFTQEEECTYNMQEPFRSEVMDLLFDKEKGAGFSLLRTEVGCGESRPTVEPEKGVWDTQVDERERWYYQKALARGVEKVYATVWTPPKWMKSTGEWYHGGRLKEECYQDFADYLAQYVKIYRERLGVELYGVSPANEPQYAAKWKSCVWTGAELRKFVVEFLYPTFRREGLDTKILLGENAAWNDRPARETLADPVGRQAVAVVTAHQYMGRIKPLAAAKAAGKPVWCSELCQVMGEYRTDMEDAVRWAARVHKFMTAAQASAFFYWRGAHTANSNETLIRIDSPSSYTVPKRLYGLAHFSRFVRPGWVRVATDRARVGKVLVSAYKNPNDGHFAIVLINTDKRRAQPLQIALDGHMAKAATPYMTTAAQTMRRVEDVSFAGGMISHTLPPQTIVTLVG